MFLLVACSEVYHVIIFVSYRFYFSVLSLCNDETVEEHKPSSAGMQKYQVFWKQCRDALC